MSKPHVQCSASGCSQRKGLSSRLKEPETGVFYCGQYPVVGALSDGAKEGSYLCGKCVQVTPGPSYGCFQHSRLSHIYSSKVQPNCGCRRSASGPPRRQSSKQADCARQLPAALHRAAARRPGSGGTRAVAWQGGAARRLSPSQVVPGRGAFSNAAGQDGDWEAAWAECHKKFLDGLFACSCVSGLCKWCSLLCRTLLGMPLLCCHAMKATLCHALQCLHPQHRCAPLYAAVPGHLGVLLRR